MTADRFNFRCWLVHENRMIEDVNLFGFGSKTEYQRDVEEIVDNGNDFITYDWIETILMQSTGKVDKKNKEAFNGDIVKLYDDNENIAQIVYSVENARFEYHRKNGDFICALCDIELNKYAEVIGNIYENKELLGE